MKKLLIFLNEVLPQTSVSLNGRLKTLSSGFQTAFHCIEAV
ncbi:hypothetical protein CYJ98_010775 [Neisseria perflava]|uniref:Uncharacterized protein n=1 Tax=Neisseria perflava TaxID=33053 RepID=A0AAF0YLA5_NEIPE|nr:MULTISPECIES: hypothetical protein [Neisseria]WOS98023.1 hypothetical protein CYJ98_010775 [Neisseria perflava]